MSGIKVRNENEQLQLECPHHSFCGGFRAKRNQYQKNAAAKKGLDGDDLYYHHRCYNCNQLWATWWFPGYHFLAQPLQVSLLQDKRRAMEAQLSKDEYLNSLSRDQRPRDWEWALEEWDRRNHRAVQSVAEASDPAPKPISKPLVETDTSTIPIIPADAPAVVSESPPKTTGKPTSEMERLLGIVRDTLIVDRLFAWIQATGAAPDREAFHNEYRETAKDVERTMQEIRTQFGVTS